MGSNPKKRDKRSGKRKRKPSGRYFIYTTATLGSLFGVSRRTICLWERAGKLNPKDLYDIIDKYTHREKLDLRKTKGKET